MLVLLSVALVLVATVLLVLGLLNDDGLTLIYASIGASVLAALVLLVAIRRIKAEELPAESPPGEGGDGNAVDVDVVDEGTGVSAPPVEEATPAEGPTEP